MEVSEINFFCTDTYEYFNVQDFVRTKAYNTVEHNYCPSMVLAIHSGITFIPLSQSAVMWCMYWYELYLHERFGAKKPDYSKYFNNEVT